MKFYAIQQTGRTPAMYFHTKGHRGEHVTETIAPGIQFVTYKPNGPAGEWSSKPNDADVWDQPDYAEAFRAANVAPVFGACTVEDITALRGAKHRKPEKPGLFARAVSAVKGLFGKP